MQAMNIRQVRAQDIDRITAIYNWYILNTIITFETEAIAPLDIKQRIEEKLKNYDWIIGEVNQEVIGYAYYGSFRSRAAYDHTVELSIYLEHDKIGKGFGATLYRELMRSAQERGFKELIGVIALPNPESTQLHQKLGFEEVGVLKRVGYKFEQYIDVGIWQKSSES